MIRRVSMSLLTLVAIVSMVSGFANAQSFQTRHVREAVLNGQAKLVGHLPANQSLRFDVVLALRHKTELDNFLQEVYDPNSPAYHQYVTVQQFTERFGPSQEEFDAVLAFAKANGFTVTGGSRDSFDVQLKGTVGNIEKAFHVTMGLYQHPTENRTFFATDREPSVDLPFALWHVTGLDNFSIPRSLTVHRDIKVQPEAVTGSCPGESFCGSDMRAAYYGGTLTGAGQNIGLLEYAGFDIADVNTYYQNAGQTRAFAVTGVSTDGSSVNCLESQGCDDTEQTLDITQSGGMAPNVTTVYVFVSDDSDTALLSSMSTYSPLPLNLSSSWTWSPADPSTDDPYFEKMASQGQSFFQAAGDSGGYRGSAPWPANSQYVITVGGTDLETQSAGGPWKSETAWADGGGGWGTNVDIPSWQQLTGVITKANEGSTTYRDVPDVSANANFTFYVCADQSGCTENEYGGTSFAAPMWAGYLALTNEQAKTNGAAAPGFINPTIYPLNLGNSDAYFHDIVAGSNGFPTETGYDLATGWGSPNGSGLLNALSGPSGPSFSLTATPSSLTIAPGSTGTSTIAVVPAGGFSGSVTLSASGLPSGVTAGFSPNPTSSNSTLTLTVAAGTAGGTSTITISGVSGSLTASTTLSLTISASGPVVSLDPTSLVFAKRAIGSTSAAKKVVLTNTGGSTLTISTIGISGDFALATVTKTKKITPCVNGGTVAAGATCEIKVTFTPTEAGTRTGSVTFTDNAPGSPQSVSLTGTGK